jgi:hypothetical protein
LWVYSNRRVKTLSKPGTESGVQTSVEMNQIRAKLAELLLCSCDFAGNLGPFVDQCRHDVTFRLNPVFDPETIEGIILGKPS